MSVAVMTKDKMNKIMLKEAISGILIFQWMVSTLPWSQRFFSLFHDREQAATHFYCFVACSLSRAEKS